MQVRARKSSIDDIRPKARNTREHTYSRDPRDGAWKDSTNKTLYFKGRDRNITQTYQTDANNIRMRDLRCR